MSDNLLKCRRVPYITYQCNFAAELLYSIQNEFWHGYIVWYCKTQITFRHSTGCILVFYSYILKIQSALYLLNCSVDLLCSLILKNLSKDRNIVKSDSRRN